MTFPFCTSRFAGGCANLHSVSDLVHLFRWNSRQTSSCNHLGSFPLMRLFMLTIAMAGSSMGGGKGGGVAPTGNRMTGVCETALTSALTTLAVVADWLAFTSDETFLPLSLSSGGERDVRKEVTTRGMRSGALQVRCLSHEPENLYLIWYVAYKNKKQLLFLMYTAKHI